MNHPRRQAGARGSRGRSRLRLLLLLLAPSATRARASRRRRAQKRRDRRARRELKACWWRCAKGLKPCAHGSGEPVVHHGTSGCPRRGRLPPPSPPLQFDGVRHLRPRAALLPPFSPSSTSRRGCVAGVVRHGAADGVALPQRVRVRAAYDVPLCVERYNLSAAAFNHMEKGRVRRGDERDAAAERDGLRRLLPSNEMHRGRRRDERHDDRGGKGGGEGAAAALPPVRRRARPRTAAPPRLPFLGAAHLLHGDRAQPEQGARHRRDEHRRLRHGLPG